MGERSFELRYERSGDVWGVLSRRSLGKGKQHRLHMSCGQLWCRRPSETGHPPLLMSK